MEIGRRSFIKGLALGAGVVLAKGYAFGAEPIAAAGPASLLLANFPLHKQETPYTCGPASLRMVLEYLGHPLAEPEISQRMGTSPKLGTSFLQMHSCYNQYLKDFKIALAAHDKIGKAANNDLIFNSLGKDRPVIFTWLVENYFKPKTLVGHYSVLIGFDRNRSEFTIANPFGSIHPIAFDRFWRLASYSPKPDDIPNVSSKSSLLRMPPDLVVLE